ncbi:pilus assembly protein [Variovorax sp. HW608]|uniref:pilus assembly protein n=1 Tax=Variovorax sp. HW608 TaxID=1034889 RepID=UPI001E5BD1E8|nr:PilC/PilY family type IV pilus protein [Variovorax sp. HW608]
MVIIDDTANNDADMGSCTYWDGTAPASPENSKSLGNYQCALANFIHKVATQPDGSAALNVGLVDMSGLLIALTPIDDKAYKGSMSVPAGTTNRQAYILAVKALTKVTGKARQGAAFQETWAYFTGGNDGTGNTGKGILSGTTYTGTSATTGCQHNYAIFLSGVKANASHALEWNNPSELVPLTASVTNAVAAKTITQAQGTNFLTPVPNKPEAGYGIEWARFMFGFDANSSASGLQSIVTYSIGTGDTAASGTTITSTMELYIKATSTYGGGKYYPAGTDPNALATDLGKVFDEIQDVNSVFSSPALPVSANLQGVYLNQVYVATFRPDASGLPRWWGNLKQYQFGVDTSNPQVGPSLYMGGAAWTWTPMVAGQSAQQALSSSTGFFGSDTVSFWTAKDATQLPDSIGGFWVSNPKAQGAGGGYDSPDGNLVEKGGVAQQLRIANLQNDYTKTPGNAKNPRNLYTCNGTCAAGALSTTLFATTNTTLNSSLGTTLINWVRGEDNAGDEQGPGLSITPALSTPINIRPSIHGDVLHSRPAVVNYGAAIGVVVFYGANDGVFHAINGNQPPATNTSPQPMGGCTVSTTCSIGGIPPGGELWGFIAPEFQGKLKRLRDNSPTVKLSTTVDTTATPKDYFFDGSTTVYQDSTKTYLFLSARRGGRMIYALDVTDPTRPAFLWKKGCPNLTDNVGCDAGFTELGQTWSLPKVTRIKAQANPVLIFGAGYDKSEDYDANFPLLQSPTAATMGRGIFVLDAFTGAPLWQAGPVNTCVGATVCSVNAGMTFPFAADIALVDRIGADGKTDRLYAADTGGNIWRVNLEPTGTGAFNTWTITKLASLGGTGTTHRKFLFPPDVVLTKTFDAVMAATGDREHPLLGAAATSVVNRFYMIKDTIIGPDSTGWTTVVDATSATADVAPSALFNATTVAYDGTLAGYYKSLTSPGEKSVNAPTTVGGITYVGTNQPVAPTNSCTNNLGIARGHQFNFLTGDDTPQVFNGGGLPPSPVFVLVTVKVPDPTDPTKTKNRTLPALIGAGGGSGPDSGSPLGAQTLPPPTTKKKRTYWNHDIDR